MPVSKADVLNPAPPSPPPQPPLLPPLLLLLLLLRVSHPLCFPFRVPIDVRTTSVTALMI